MVRAADLSGETYGQLTVTGRGPSDDSGKAQWFCACQCGRNKLIRAQSLRDGRTRSCGECGAVQKTGIDPNAIRFHVTVWSGPNSPSGKPFCFGEVRDVEGRLVFRTSPPVNREVTKGELHAGATRCMTALAAQRLIDGHNNRTGKRWAIEERVSIDVKRCSTEDETFERWYEVSGEPRPVPAELSREQGARPVIETPPLTPDQQAGFDDLMQHWAKD